MTLATFLSLKRVYSFLDNDCIIHNSLTGNKATLIRIDYSIKVRTKAIKNNFGNSYINCIARIGLYWAILLGLLTLGIRVI